VRGGEGEVGVRDWGGGFEDCHFIFEAGRLGPLLYKGVVGGWLRRWTRECSEMVGVIGGWWLEVDVCLDVGERGQGS
jgi:hypothetical protein